MGILRRIVSFIVLAAGIVVLVGLCMSSSMSAIWPEFSAAINPFNFQALADALSHFIIITGNSIVLIMLGFIGLTIRN